MFISEDDEVLHERLADVVTDWCCKKIGQMRRKVCGFFWIADGDLRNERDEFSKVVGVVVWADEKELSCAVVVVILLQKLFFVRRWIPLDQVLQLRQIRGELQSSSHPSIGTTYMLSQPQQPRPPPRPSRPRFDSLVSYPSPTPSFPLCPSCDTDSARGRSRHPPAP